MQPRWEVADVLHRTDLTNIKLNAHQRKTLTAIGKCRTAALGGHVDACDECGQIHISYNSCRNRHCPKCQGHKRQEWVHNREADLLPCRYYHVVFTLPHQLNALALHKPTIVYNALFKAAWQTLNQFGTGVGLRLGMVSVLHTWGQNLSLHPHLHCIVPGGGVDSRGVWKKKIRGKRFLFSVKALSKVFRAKYVSLLRGSGIQDRDLFDSLFNTKWVVYAKSPFAGPKQVIEYLGRYTHKVAISNHRIRDVSSQQVSFNYKDYREEGVKKTMTLKNEEFIRRFSMHILPFRFVRIRHYGILSSTWKRGRLQSLQASLNVIRPPVMIKPVHIRKCPCCKTGNLILIEHFGERGPPAIYLINHPTVSQA